MLHIFLMLLLFETVQWINAVMEVTSAWREAEKACESWAGLEEERVVTVWTGVVKEGIRGCHIQKHCGEAQCREPSESALPNQFEGLGVRRRDFGNFKLLLD